MKAKYWIPSCAIASLRAIELALRLLGFGNPALLQADANADYIFAPNQLVYRFGNRHEYNQFSQRSEKIDAAKPEGTLRIVMIGDSVLNGNNTPISNKLFQNCLKRVCWALKSKLRC